MDFVPTTQATPEPDNFPTGFDEEEIIDVFPDGKSAHTTYYPFDLHENLVLPWD